jgi:hypothetical protein
MTAFVITGGRACLNDMQSVGLSVYDRILTISAMWLLWYALGIKPLLLGYEYKRRGVIRFAKDCWYNAHDIDHDFVNSTPKSIIELALAHVGIDKVAWYQFTHIAQLLEIHITTEYVSPYDDLMCCHEPVNATHTVSTYESVVKSEPVVKSITPPTVEPKSPNTISVEKMVSLLFQ